MDAPPGLSRDVFEALPPTAVTLIEWQAEQIRTLTARLAEALRHGVIWRKLLFGTQSAAGSWFVERFLTVIETCRRQERNVFTSLVEAVHAHIHGKHAASLLAGV
jgi:hypothetical protein